jgi:hypothetical protein
MTNAVAIAQQGSNNTTFRNRIINGAMMISQRNGTSSFTPTDGSYNIDRFALRLTQASKYTTQQNAGSVTPPTGFIDYLGITSSSAYSVVSSDFFAIEQWIEGYNCADLGWGTVNAKTVTLSFWVQSSLTGSFGGSLRTYAGGQSYPFSYSIPSANTWTNISVTIPGATAGTWNTTNSGCIGVAFSLGAGSSYSGTAGAWAASTLFQPTGSVSVVGTSGATFYVTGVQLEAGSAASPFENRLIGTEFALCQRYYQQSLASGGNPAFQLDAYGTSGTYPAINVPYQVAMRTLPTATVVGTWSFVNCTLYQFSASPNCALLLSQASGTGRVVINASTTGTGYSFSAEL